MIQLLYMKIISILILVILISSTINTDAEQTTLNLYADKSKVAPGESILFVVSSTLPKNITFSILYSNYTIVQTSMQNVTKAGRNYLWQVPEFATNGTYKALAQVTDNTANFMKISFAVIRSDTNVRIKHYYLIAAANISFVDSAGNLQKEWNANITNLYSTQQISVYVDNYFLILPDSEKSLSYELGNPIQITAKNQRWNGQKIFVGTLGQINGTIAGSINRNITSTILTIVYISATFITIVILVRKSKKQLVNRNSYIDSRKIDISDEKFY